MTLSPTMRHALSHMAQLERIAAESDGTLCPNAVLDGSGVTRGTANALVRRGLAENVKWCRFGADWPALRLTESGRGLAPTPEGA